MENIIYVTIFPNGLTTSARGPVSNIDGFHLLIFWIFLDINRGLISSGSVMLVQLDVVSLPCVGRKVCILP